MWTFISGTLNDPKVNQRDLSSSEHLQKNRTDPFCVIPLPDEQLLASSPKCMYTGLMDTLLKADFFTFLCRYVDAQRLTKVTIVGVTINQLGAFWLGLI